jgi:peptidoglycan/LPS O-acetylase OafA/YrhL
VIHSLPIIPRNNNIGLLRLLFAAIVMLSHTAGLSLSPALTALPYYANSNLAVQGFFVLSGFLVMMSYENARGVRDYAGKRFRRIYPAYATVILVCALAGYFITNSADYFNISLLHYVSANLFFMNFLAPDLPGVFTQNPLTAINGALWTIKIEVMFYLCVPLLAWLLRNRFRLPLIAVIYFGSLLFTQLCTHYGRVELSHQLPGQMCYFISGIALLYYFEWVIRHLRILFPLALMGCAISVVSAYDILYPACSAIVVIVAAFTCYLGNAERYGDLSYGIYIWHFPIIQTLVMFGLFEAHPVGTIFITALITGATAFVSWRLIEKPALKKSSHYIAAEIKA